MEALMDRTKRSGSTISDDKSLRLSKPPGRGTGKVAENLGQSGFALEKSQPSRKVSATNRKANGRVERDPQMEPIVIPDGEEDDDEIDFLSDIPGDNDSHVESHLGNDNAFDPVIIEKKNRTLKDLHFKKKDKHIENQNANFTTNKPRESKVLEPKSPNLSSTSWQSLPLKSSAKPQSRFPSQSLEKPTEERADARRRRIGRNEQSSESDLEVVGSSARSEKGKQKESVEAQRPKKEKPKARPVPKPSSTLFEAPVGKQPAPASFPLSVNDTPKKITKSFADPPVSFDSTPRPTKSALPFPVAASPATRKFSSIQHDPFPVSPNIPQKPGKKAKSKAVAPSTVAPFPVSLEDSQCTSRAGPSHRHIGKKRASIGSAEEDDSPSKKRRREENYLSSSPPQGLQYNDDSDEEENLFYNPQVDANTLCPYCDEPLPSSPTPHLERLLATTAKRSKRAPRPTNPLGRKATLSIFVNVCQRHRFESELLPEAEEKGWPKSIKWGLIHERVLKLKDHLESILENRPGSHGDDDDSDEDETGEWEIGSRSRKKPHSSSSKSNAATPRDRCVFWEDIIKDVKEKGSRVAGNVKSQFANFQKTQPGYYGELGSVLIHQSLYELFPPEDMRPDLVSPLSPKDFIDRVLLPEVAVRLIMEDKCLSGSSGADTALKILRDSSSYGVSMFPVDGGEDGGEDEDSDRKGKGKARNMRRGKAKDKNQLDGADEDEADNDIGIADRMAREKARRRRLELQKEDEQEEEMIQQEREQRESKGKSKRKQKEAEPAVRTTSPQKSKPKPRPKPKTRTAKTLPSADLDLGAEGQHASSDSDMDVPVSDIDDPDIANLDAALAMMDESEPPRSASSLSSRAVLDERVDDSNRGDAMIVSSGSEAESNGDDNPRRRTRARKLKATSVVPSRSPSIVMISRPPSTSSVDVDVTPRAHKIHTVESLASSSSSSSYNRNEGTPGSSLGGWDDDCGVAPIDYLKQRGKPDARKKPPQPRQKAERRSKLSWSDSSKFSDPGWILDDD